VSLVVLHCMSGNSIDERTRKTRWWHWFGGGAEDEPETSKSTPTYAASGARDPTAREVWLPAKRRMISKIADFLIDHDFEVMPATLTIAYDCVTGGAPRLAQSILERAEKGLPITLSWIEEQRGESNHDKNGEALAVLMGRLEGNLEDFSSTASGARTATSEYNSALQRHVDDLENANQADIVIHELTALTRAMMKRTKAIESELETSERRAQSLQTTLEETRRMANLDHLTGLPNRRAFERTLDRELRDAAVAGEALTIAFVDIDHFKRVNDTHGHPAGDRVLKFVSETLNNISDSRCFVARHGGEEFAILWRNLSVKQAWEKLDGAREEIAQRQLINRANDRPFGRITFSGGIADVFGYAEKSAALKAADEALYAAKQAGRNRIHKAAGELNRKQVAA
jgi:diguanylate cyclase